MSRRRNCSRLTLSTSTGTRGEAQFVCCNIYNGFVTLSPPDQLSKSSGPLYVPKSEPTVRLALLGQARNRRTRADGDARHPGAHADAGDARHAAVGPGAAGDAGRLALRHRHRRQAPALLFLHRRRPTAPAAARSAARYGDRVARFTNYTGDIVGGGREPRSSRSATCRAGTNTLTLTSSLPATTPVTARLVPIAPATALAVGAERQRQHRRLRAPLLHLRRGRGPGLHGAA